MNENPYAPPRVGLPRDTSGSSQAMQDATPIDRGARRVEFELAIDDLVEFEVHRRQRDRSKTSSRLNWLWHLVTVILVLGLAFRMYKSNVPYRFAYIGGLLTFCISVVGRIYWARNHGYIRALRKQLRQPQFAEAFQPQIVTIDSTGVEHRCGHSTSTTSWAGISRLDSTERTVLICLSDEVAVVIPKLAFANRTELEAFVGSAKQYLKTTHAALEQSQITRVPAPLPTVYSPIRPDRVE
jgi:hypothetical protein